MKCFLRGIAVGGVAALFMSSAMASADVVLDWNAIMLNTVGGQTPFAQARFAAITQTAVFEAVNAITGDYEPYLGTVAAPPGSSAEAAVVAAAHGVLKNYFPGSAASLDVARANSLAAIPDGSAKDNGIAVGEAAAAAMIALRAKEALSDQNRKVKEAALRLLSNKKEAAATEMLRRGLNDADPEFRIEVLEILAERGDIDSLRKAVADRNRDVRETAADLLFKSAQK